MEVGRRVSPHIRIAFEVDDSTRTTDELVANGASVIAGPVEKPWKSSNSRLEGAAGLQLTLFTELEVESERTTNEGFGTTSNRSRPTGIGTYAVRGITGRPGPFATDDDD